jgi:hypothetical protein
VLHVCKRPGLGVVVLRGLDAAKVACELWLAYGSGI